MEDDLKWRQPKQKTNSIEDNLKVNFKRKTTLMEDYINRNDLKIISMALVEEDICEIQPQEKG